MLITPEASNPQMNPITVELIKFDLLVEGLKMVIGTLLTLTAEKPRFLVPSMSCCSMFVLMAPRNTTGKCFLFTTTQTPQVRAGAS